MAFEEDQSRIGVLEDQLRSNTKEIKSTSVDVKNIESLLVGMRQDQIDHSGQMDQIMLCLTKLSGAEKGLPPPPMTPSDSSGLAWKATTHILEKQLNEMNDCEHEEIETLRLNVDELQKETSAQTEQLLNMQNDRNKWKHEAELLMQDRDMKFNSGGEREMSSLIINFPSNETVIHNLLMAQIEFYFSDHHLKRDKPLMTKLTQNPLGYIPFEEVCTFPKVRTLGQDKDIVKKSILGSKYLSTKMDENGVLLYVGREQFNPPRAQEFPFRRTVFVYGISPQNATELWIRNQFDCFGTIVKVKFDSGPRSSPRKVGARLLKKEPSRVTRLQIQDANHTEFQFSKFLPENLTQYICHKCNRLKEYSDGYYASTTTRNAYLFCIQCAAKKAEENLKNYNTKYRNHFPEHTDVRDLYGIDDNAVADINSFVSCLIVYESQRQASKCVYVRSRLGIDGCFATHFHNYTRNKKEICNGEDDGIMTPPGLMKRESSHKLVPIAMTHTKTGGARFERNHVPPKMERTRSAPGFALNSRDNYTYL